MEFSNTALNHLSQREKYKLLIGSIVPRPIAWISTVSKSGILNLAPFSFFNAACTCPPMVCVSIGEGEDEREGTVKDTLTNIRDTKQFVVNMVPFHLSKQMHKSSGNFQPGVDEFAGAGVTPMRSKAVNPPKVQESPINMECQLEQIIPLGFDHLVIGRIIYFHIHDDLYNNGKIDVPMLKPLARLAGEYTYIDKTFKL